MTRGTDIDWDSQITAADVSMCGSDSYYSLEDLYQAFKARLQREIEILGDTGND